MKTVRIGLIVVGALAILLGILWMAQGSGLFPYPAASFMIDQTAWIINGAVLAFVGMVILLMGRRLPG